MEPYTENHQSQPSNSGLLRFRSAPSSLLSNFKGYDFIQSPTVDSGESLPRYLSSGGGDVEGKQGKVSQNGYSGLGQNQLPPQYSKPGLVMEGPIRVNGSSTLTGQSTQGKVGGGGGSNLTRQNSSPAGFFSHLNPQNGYGMNGGIGNFRVAGSSNGGEELSPPHSSRLKSQIDFAPGLSNYIGHLPRIPEIGAETTKDSSPERYRNGEENAGFYSTGFSFTSWNDSNTSGPKRHQHIDKIPYGLVASASQNGAFPHLVHMLSHHLSLPKTSAEMAAVEKLLKFQDTVPCKIRAKRGCATHPRSISERVRRTRISERMKKLQELVPNMEKQVSISDMLDLAVEYIKYLQKQYKMLRDNRARCKCLHVQQSAINLAS